MARQTSPPFMLKLKRMPLELTEDRDIGQVCRQPEVLKHVRDTNRNRLIPNQVMDTVRKAYNQSNLANFIDVHPLKAVARQEAELQPQIQQAITSDFSFDKPNATKIEEVIGQVAAKVAKDTNANCIVSVEKGQQDTENLNYLSVKVVIFKKVKRNTYDKHEYLTRMRKQISGSVLPLKELLMEAIKKNYVVKNDRVVCVGDESVGMGYQGLLFIFDVNNIFFNMSIHQLSERISPDVLEAVINLALEISSEGREGRKIGTSFIIGQTAELGQYTKQMIINPFANCPEELRNVLDPNIKETVKGFAQLDGVFIIDERGVIQSAGSHLNIDLNKADLSGLDGFGTRHRYSAAITKVANAVAIVVSESGGTVRIFKEGKLVLKM